MMHKLSVVLATYNEEANLADCLRSVKGLADEIIVVDGSSTDRTVEIAKSFGAVVIVTTNPPLFHINKQKALEQASHEWILQLDADERVSAALGREIQHVLSLTDEEREVYQKQLKQRDLFLRHQMLIAKRDGRVGTGEGAFNAFFIPRLNYFLGRYLRFGGVYPDGVIRLVRKGKAHFPSKDVHEQIAVEGRVGWLASDLYHIDSPTFTRYLARNNRYIMLLSDEIKEKKNGEGVSGFFRYVIFLPLSWFLMTYIRHKGFLDSWQGFVFSFFSSLRFPRAYILYLKKIR